MLPYLHIPVYGFGRFSVQVFGILIAIGVVWGARLARQRAEELGLDVNLTLDSVFWAVVGGFFLSHVFSDLLYYPELVLQNPLRLLMPWLGISSFGGFLGGFLILIAFYKHRGAPLLAYLDVIVYGFLPAFFLGRVGCAIAHDHPGLWVPAKPLFHGDVGLFYPPNTDTSIFVFIMGWDNPWLWLTVFFVGLWLAFLSSRWQEKIFWSLESLLIVIGSAMISYVLHPFLGRLLKSLALHWPVDWFDKATPSELQRIHLFWSSSPIRTHPRYDLGLLEALYLGVLMLLVFALAKGRPRREGFLLAFFFTAYAPVRFALDTLRVDEIRYLGFTPGQYLALLTGALGIGCFFLLSPTRWHERAENTPLACD
jgi:prolipoprotein diacylglyceryltransferase